MLSPRAVREFCATCGWPLDGPRCGACGADRLQQPPGDAGRRIPPNLPEDTTGLERAADAWQRRDFLGMVAHCVSSVSAEARSVAHADGPGFIVPIDSALVFVAVHSTSGDVVLESPVARLPKRQRVPVLRLALEFCARPVTLARLCVRGDLLVLRFVGRLDATKPSILRALLRDAGALSERCARELAAFDAGAPLSDQERRDATWQMLGRPHVLGALAPPAPPSAPPPAPDEFHETPSRRRSGPPIVGPRVSESIPPILAPALSGPSQAPPLPREVLEDHRSTVPDLDFDVPARRRTTVNVALDELAATPADLLCELLRQAQALATALSFGERPTTMLVLVRASVFRAIYEHGDAVPDAVARLYREAFAAMQSSWASSGDGRGMQSSVAEPALLVMADIVRQRAAVAKEAPLTLEPLTSAEDVKQHLARYADEIGHAPPDDALRYFLAVGALTEVLVRTKLPQKTEERLREIVRMALRDGTKTSSIELLMRSITRIIRG